MDVDSIERNQDSASQRQEDVCSSEEIASARRLVDIDKFFSYKYPPDSKNYKYYFGGLSLVVVTLILTIIGVATSPGHATANSGKPRPEDIDFDPRIEIAGTYRLSANDENFKEYLRSLGINNIIINVIAGTKEVMIVTEPTLTNPNFTLTTKTGTIPMGNNVKKFMPQLLVIFQSFPVMRLLSLWISSYLSLWIDRGPVMSGLFALGHDIL